MGEPFECPTPSAMAYDLFKALRVWEWFDRSDLDKWEGLQFCDDAFPKNPGRRLLLVSRRLGWDLADELKPRFGIILNLRPGREKIPDRSKYLGKGQFASTFLRACGEMYPRIV